MFNAAKLWNVCNPKLFTTINGMQNYKELDLQSLYKTLVLYMHLFSCHEVLQRLVPTLRLHTMIDKYSSSASVTKY